MGYEPPPPWAVAGRGILCENRAWPRARVAELVDALVSGISDGNIVGVRVPSRAPKDGFIFDNLMIFGLD